MWTSPLFVYWVFGGEDMAGPCQRIWPLAVRAVKPGYGSPSITLTTRRATSSLNGFSRIGSVFSWRNAE